MVKRWALGVKTGEPVTVEEAERRALATLTGDPVPASFIADKIWPDHNIKPQGAGGAASRVLKRLADEGKARWTSDARRWGWIKI